MVNVREGVSKIVCVIYGCPQYKKKNKIAKVNKREGYYCRLTLTFFISSLYSERNVKIDLFKTDERHFFKTWMDAQLQGVNKKVAPL